MARLRLWIGASAGDVVTRLCAQMISTIVVARVLSPEDFGVASMVLSAVAILGALVSLPFEEALTQRSSLRTGHLETALFASLVLTAVSFVVVLALAPIVARAAGAPELALWLPVATLFLFGQGPGSIVRAVARRRRRFVAMAVGQSSSVVVASALSIGAALAGLGVFALVLQRMLPIVLYPVLAMAAARGPRTLIRPRWHADRFRDIFRFSWLHLARVGVDYTTPAALTFMVNAFFGTAVLGQLNVAMRLTEPLRSGIASVGHNLVLSLLVRLQTDVPRLVGGAFGTVANFATLAVPVFLGLGVCAPILLPLLVGPGWDEAIPLARVVCVAAAISVPFRYLYSGYSALGRPELSLACTSLGLVTMVIGIQLVARLGGPDLLGVPIIAAEAAAALLGTLLYLPLAGRHPLAPLLKVARTWIAAGVMVLVLDLVFLQTAPPDAGVLRLAGMVAAGGVIYFGVLFVICRTCLDNLRSLLKNRKE